MSLPLLLSIGGLSGLVAGLVGLAGGIVIVPALTWVYGPTALHGAIVVSWFSVLFNSISAVSKQFSIRSSEERRQLLSSSKWFLLGTALVTPLVSLGASQWKHLVARSLVAVLQLSLALVMLLPMRDIGQDTERPSRPLMDASIGGLIGGVSTLIGIGGGTYTIAYFVYSAGTRFRDAIAMANLTGLMVGTLSVIGYLSSLMMFQHAASQQSSPIDSSSIAVMVLGGMLAAPLGVRLAHRLHTKTLRTILIAALMFSAVRLLLAH